MGLASVKKYWKSLYIEYKHLVFDRQGMYFHDNRMLRILDK